MVTSIHHCHWKSQCTQINRKVVTSPRHCRTSITAIHVHLPEIPVRGVEYRRGCRVLVTLATAVACTPCGHCYRRGCRVLVTAEVTQLSEKKKNPTLLTLLLPLAVSNTRHCLSSVSEIPIVLVNFNVAVKDTHNCRSSRCFNQNVPRDVILLLRNGDNFHTYS